MASNLVLLFALIFGSMMAGIYLERSRARWSRYKWLAKQGINEQNRRAESLGPQHHRILQPTDAAEQLRIVLGANFQKRRLLSKSESRVLYAAERAVKQAGVAWRVMAQVSLGEVLSSPDARAYAAINSKRVDILIVSSGGVPIAAVEYQGSGHFQGSAAARDAVKREALRKAGVRYIEVTPEHDFDDVVQEIMRVAKALAHPAGVRCCRKRPFGRPLTDTYISCGQSG